jgi:hypothetical protein
LLLAASVAGCQLVAGLKTIDYSPDGSSANPDGSVTPPATGIFAPVCSGTGWCWVHPLPLGNDLNTVWVQDKVVRIGGDGTTLLLGDGRAAWQWVTVPADAPMSIMGMWVPANGGFHSIHGTSPTGTVWMGGTDDVFHATPAGANTQFTVVDDTGCIGTNDAVVAVGPDAWVAGGTMHQLKRATTAKVTCEHDFVTRARAIWAAPDGTVFMAGGDDSSDAGLPNDRGYGKIARYTGANELGADAIDATLNGIDGVDANNVWAVGRAGKAVHWDGKAWKSQDTGMTRKLFAVHVAPDGRVFAGGERGAIAVLENGTWATSPTPIIDENLWAVFAASSSAVWTIGDDAAVWKYDGKAWSSEQLGLSSTTHPRDMHGTGADDVWLGLADGTVRHFDGKAWSPDSGFKTDDVHSLYAPAKGEVWVGSNSAVHHFENGAWAAPLTIAAPKVTRVTQVWSQGGAPHDVWVLTETDNAPSKVYRSTGGAPLTVVPGPGLQANEVLSSLRGVPTTGEIWVATNNGRLFHYNGAGWTAAKWIGNPSNGNQLGSTGDTLWNVGYGGVVGSYDGTNWTRQSLPYQGAINGVNGPSNKEIWMVGERGTVLVHH